MIKVKEVNSNFCICVINCFLIRVDFSVVFNFYKICFDNLVELFRYSYVRVCYNVVKMVNMF